MKAQIISIIIILIAALIIAILGLLIHKEEKRLESYFKFPIKWPKFKK